MKRWSVILPLAALFLLLLPGCSSHQTAGEPVIEGPDVAEPPCQLIFYGTEEFAAFVESANLSDDTFAAFLADHEDWSWNGIKTRDDVRTVLKLAEKVRLPVSDGYALGEIIIRPEPGLEDCDIMLRADSGLGCTFRFSLDSDKTVDDHMRAAAESTTLVPVDLGLRSDVADAFFLENGENGVQSFAANIGDCYVLCRVHGAADLAESTEILKNFSFETPLTMNGVDN